MEDPVKVGERKQLKIDNEIWSYRHEGLNSFPTTAIYNGQGEFAFTMFKHLNDNEVLYVIGGYLQGLKAQRRSGRTDNYERGTDGRRESEIAEWMETIAPLLEEYSEGEPLDGDAVDDLVEKLRVEISFHQGNLTRDEYLERKRKIDEKNDRTEATEVVGERGEVQSAGKAWKCKHTRYATDVFDHEGNFVFSSPRRLNDETAIIAIAGYRSGRLEGRRQKYCEILEAVKEEETTEGMHA